MHIVVLVLLIAALVVAILSSFTRVPLWPAVLFLVILELLGRYAR